MGKLGWLYKVCTNKLSGYLVGGKNDPDLEAGWPLVKGEPGRQGVLQGSQLCSSNLARLEAFEMGTSAVDL